MLSSDVENIPFGPAGFAATAGRLASTAAILGRSAASEVRCARGRDRSVVAARDVAPGDQGTRADRGAPAPAHRTHAGSSRRSRRARQSDPRPAARRELQPRRLRRHRPGRHPQRRFPRDPVLVAQQLLYFEPHAKLIAPHWAILDDPDYLAVLFEAAIAARDQAR